ncbi:glycosyltransferase [Pyxidicoccus trucidator]|uniref:glycosyltransferase n=1 Tax=Pyxidicoccus trucidator TaxID=2709662 RepID=UPI001F07E64B|nr:glycosyltransferase [Pyxidicoccus trucidator]
MTTGPWTLWLYWEGVMPAYIQLCSELLQAFHPNAVLVVPETLSRYGIDSAKLSHMHVAQRSDCIRTALLHDFGGMWCDIDCIPLRTFELLYRLAEKSSVGFASYDSTDDTIGYGFTASLPRAPVIARQHEQVMAVVNSGRAPRWLEVSTEPLTQIVREVGRENMPLLPLYLTQPVVWHEQQRFSVRGSDEEHRKHLAGNPSAFCYMLSNQCMADDVKRLTRHELLTSDRFISFLFRESASRARALRGNVLARGKAVMTLNLYGDGLRQTLRDSQRAAAERWGAEYVEITRPMYSWPDAYWEKLNLDRHAQSYERVVFLDRDVMVRADCPSPFELVPAESFGGICSEQEGHQLRENVEAKMEHLYRSVGVALDYEREYLNSGVLVFSPREHGNVFDAARYIHMLTHERSWEVYDQGCISLALKFTQTPLHVLPPTFNRCGARLWYHWTPRMDDYVWHFCGSKNVTHMDNTLWREVGATGD